ncbi:MAG: 4Fe-4S ferredoxin [Candidatus Riflebacteria bacterium HGW-Riflebacteria-2]|nr:MAG: 4Fe-4S ferredoxin [Candidatus Riflebacteria bacterium HGW-Riflebacteria-2]
MHRIGLNIRFWVQAAATLLTNAYLKGFKAGTLYTGSLKHVCVPTLNCYSCPAAMYSCPIGALQVTIAGAGGLDITATQGLWARLVAISTSLPMLTIGFLMLVGGVVGRAACGWICPFGWLQELLNKIPSPKFNGPQFVKYAKYIILIVFVFLLPAFWLDEFDGGEPSFCKYVCPAGTLEGGLPIALLQPQIRSQLGWLFTWKASMLALILVLSVFFRRPFCRWICPLGAFYGPLNRVSLYKLEINKDACIECGACSKKCPVSLDVPRQLDNAECLRCLECRNICPVNVISLTGPGLKTELLTPKQTAEINEQTD